MKGRKNSNLLHSPKDNIYLMDRLQQQPIQQMLLSNDRNDKRHDSIIEAGDQLFDLYITPYSEKGQYEKIQSVNTNQHRTALKGNKKNWIEINTRTNHKENNKEYEIFKLKQIIDKKDSKIKQLVQQLHSLKDEISDFYNRNKAKMINQKSNNIQNEQDCTAGANVQTKQKNFKKQLSFLQQNNHELYTLMIQYKNEKELQQTQIKNILQSNQTLSKKVVELTEDSCKLKNNNKKLVKQAQQYLKDGNKQIQLVNKMRNMLAQKLNLKDKNVDKNHLQSKNNKFLNQQEKQNSKNKRSNSTTAYNTKKHHSSSQKFHSKQNPQGIRVSYFQENFIYKKMI